MKTRAKFEGRCWACQQTIGLGTWIEYRPGRPAKHHHCKDEWPEDATIVTAGPGLRYESLAVGQVVEHPVKGRLRIVHTSKRYLQGDGREFGMDVPSGWLTLHRSPDYFDAADRVCWRILCDACNSVVVVVCDMGRITLVARPRG